MTVMVVDNHNGLCGKGSKYIGINPREVVGGVDRGNRQRVLRQYCDSSLSYLLFTRHLLSLSLSRTFQDGHKVTR